MAGEPRPGFAHPGPKRPQDMTIFRVDKSKKTPLLINQVPAKSLRPHLSPRVNNTYCPCPYKACRDSRLPPGQRKFQTEELDSIRRELSKIKAQVDSLLKSLEFMEQQRDQHTGQVKTQASDQDSQEVETLPGSIVTSSGGLFPRLVFGTSLVTPMQPKVGARATQVEAWFNQSTQEISW